jgi:hypothetical protein
MLKRLLVAASLLFSISCATAHTYVIPFANTLRLQEEHDLVGEDNPDIGGNEELLQYLPQLNDIAEELHYNVIIAGRVLWGDGGMELWGFTDIKNHTIYLSLDQSGNNFIHTYIHELSHAMQPMPLSDAGQVFAESVACLVTGQLGWIVVRRHSPTSPGSTTTWTFSLATRMTSTSW